jgi:hypothetical protein
MQGGLHDCLQRRGAVGVGGYHHRDRPREDAEEALQEYFGEQPPPEPGVAAAAKARLPLGERGSRAAWRLRYLLAGGWRPSRRALLLRAGLSATVVAAAAAVIAVAAVQAPSPVPASGSGGSQVPTSDPYGDPGYARLLPLSTAPGKLTPQSASYGSQPFLVGDKALSLRQLLALPADPARLKELLLTGSSHYPRVSQSAYLLQAVPPVLQMPVTPAVRSALYRMLAAMPGIRSLGTVKDVSGKQGAAVEYAGRYANCGNGISLNAASRVLFTSCTVQQVLVIDPATGLPQAEELRYTQLPPGQKWSAPSGLFS